MTLNILENFSGLLGKQYLFLQDDGTYYNRYTDEYMTAADAEHWLYSELSEVINKWKDLKIQAIPSLSSLLNGNLKKV